MHVRLPRVALALVLAVSPALAGDDEPVAPGGSPAPGALPGPLVLYEPRPSADVRACSFEVPVCVGASRATSGEAVLAILRSAEGAWRTLAGPLGLPSPDVDPDTLSYDLFVADGPDLASTHLGARDVRSRFDRGRSFTRIDPRVRPGCQLDGLVARELARASLFRSAPGTPDGVALAQATYLSQLVAPCSLALAADAARAFQSAASRTVCDARAGEPHAAPTDPPGPPEPASALYARGASLWWSRLDWAYGHAPGAIVMATWALSPTITELGAERWRNEPDAFDVLRKSFEGALFTGSTFADLALDAAVARAFLGAADDGVHQPETRTLGDAAAVPLDWDLPWPDRPRRVTQRAPVHPTGASYLAVRTAGAPPGARLRVEIAWEEHALFRWAMVKLDARGRELGRVVIPTRDRALEAQMSLVDLDGVDRVLLVGVNAGDPAYRFDPDEEVWEPHGWLVTVAAE